MVLVAFVMQEVDIEAGMQVSLNKKPIQRSQPVTTNREKKKFMQLVKLMLRPVHVLQGLILSDCVGSQTADLS